LQAQAAIKANEYLANILEVLQGQTPDHNPFTLNASTTVSGTKPVPVQIAGPVLAAQRNGANSAPAQDAPTGQQITDLKVALTTMIQRIDNVTNSAQANTQTIVSAITNGNVRAAAAALSGPRTMQPPRFSQPA